MKRSIAKKPDLGRDTAELRRAIRFVYRLITFQNRFALNFVPQKQLLSKQNRNLFVISAVGLFFNSYGEYDS